MYPSTVPSSLISKGSISQITSSPLVRGIILGQPGEMVILSGVDEHKQETCALRLSAVETVSERRRVISFIQKTVEFSNQT